jgi:serine O-acetyltransferase
MNSGGTNVETGPENVPESREGPRKRPLSLFGLIATDLRRKALWSYEDVSWRAILKVLFTDGTPAMILYRLMQWSRRYHLSPLEMLFNKLTAICCNCIIGRGAEFGPGLVLLHSTGVVIHGRVRGGSNVTIYHQVTIGAERRQSPTIGSDVLIGAGAKVIGAVVVGDGARIGANAVVVEDVPPHVTAVGVPARLVRARTSSVGSPTSGSPESGSSSSRLEYRANARSF